MIELGVCLGNISLERKHKMANSTNHFGGGGFVVGSGMLIPKSFEVGYVVLEGRGKFTKKSWMWRSTYTTVHQERVWRHSTYSSINQMTSLFA
jgi:hypothetical protein